MGGIPNNRFIIKDRRERVFVMVSKGFNETEIAKQLNVDQSTICRDLKSIKKQSQKMIESIVQDLLPYELIKSLISIEQIIKKCWKIYDDTSGQWTNKNKMDSLKLIKEANITKNEILLQGPLSLRAQQVEEQVRQLIEESEMPKKSFMNLGLPTLKGQQEKDFR